MKRRAFSEPVVALVEQALANLAARCPGLSAASVSTKDGFPVATYPQGGVATKLPVMAGTMHALGDSIASECVLQECLNVTVEGRSGRMILLAVPGFREELVLMGIANAATSLGMLLCFGRDCCAEITNGYAKLQAEEVAAVAG